MESIGFQFHQDIVWHKVTGGVKRAGVTIQHPYPGYYCPNIMTEYILIFVKPGPKIYRGRSPQERRQGRIPIDSLFTREYANNIWHIAPVPPNQYDHPCPFPEEIPYRLTLLYSYEGETVLDPFMGIGTTAKVALRMGRKIYGYETKQKYIEAAEERMKEPLKLRRQLVPVFDKMPVRAEGLAQYDDGRGSSQLALFVPRRRHDSVNRSVSRHAG
jgi:site-specific DNA-methyltransferase (adenine-specific)